MLRRATREARARRAEWAPHRASAADETSLYAFTLDLLLARRLLAGLEASAPLRSRGDAFCRDQLQQQSFTAPPSWAPPPGGPEPEPCAVCLEAVAPGESVVLGPACLHRLHTPCALRLAATAQQDTPRCPTCRAPLLAVECRAPGEPAPSGRCAGGGGSALALQRTSLRAMQPEELFYLQMLLAQAGRPGAAAAWLRSPALAHALDDDDEDGESTDSEEEEYAEADAYHRQRSEASHRRQGSSPLARWVCGRNQFADGAMADDEPEQQEGDAPPPPSVGVDAAGSAAATPRGAAAPQDGEVTRRSAERPRVEQQPQCGCSVM